ncbi:MAG: exopolysaccharide biosynthesis polyprenyl glycosylphosphotransferase [Pseudomonadota bacterium]
MVVTDLIGIAFGHVLAAFLADLLRVKVGLGDAVAWQLLQERDRAIVLLSLLTVGIFAFGGLYRRNTWESDEIRRIVTGVALIALFDVALQFIVRDHFSRLWFLTAYPTIALSVLVFRMSLRSLPAVQTAMTSHIVLLGDGTPPDLFVDQLRESRSGKVKLLGNIPLDQIAGRDPTALQKLVLRLARDASIDPQRVVIIVSPSMAEAERAQEVMALLDASKTSYSIVLPFDGLARGGLDLQKVIGSDMILAEVRNESWNVAAQLVKRGFDLLAASLVFVVLLPLLTVISVCLLAEGGPIFFKQLRVGRNGNRFWCYKFRSMRPDAEERLADLLASDLRARTEWSVHQKLSHDPRITRFGATLRKTSLDELPQLINVFRGDMSLVGPRPIVAPEVPGYPGDHSYYESEGIKYYLSARPGVTGLWQVSGRASTTHEERVRLDRWYVRNWSVWLDLTILLKTVRVVFNGRGSS